MKEEASCERLKWAKKQETQEPSLLETRWERTLRRKRHDRQCPKFPKRKREKEVGDVWHLDFSVPMLPAQLTCILLPIPLAWLSFLSLGSEVDGGASRNRVRWLIAYFAGARIPLQMVELE